jgi:hypothetical protein
MVVWKRRFVLIEVDFRFSVGVALPDCIVPISGFEWDFIGIVI